ncbi:MAG: AlpA family phage regulatory protein [Gammaproteobacteria bacterium]|nr:AlpA family phage regulatory protein [Gammaproteobacteria bacterium]
MEPKLVRLRAVQNRVGLGKTTIYGLIRCGRFPPPIRLGRRCSAWLNSDIDAWIAAQVARTRSRQ